MLSRKLLPFNIKPINPIQKYLHIIKSNAKIFVMIFLFLMNFLISFGIYSNPKLSKEVTLLLLLTYKDIQWVPIVLNSSRFMTYAPSFISDKLFLQ